MPTFDVKEKPKDKSSGETDGKESSRGVTRQFTIVVIGDTAGVDANYVRAFAPLPAIGVPHPNDPGLFCRGTDVEKVSDIFYEAEATYFTPQGGGNPNDQPTLQPAVLRWGHVDTDEEIDQDADGSPIMTVTNEGFDPPIRRQFGDLQLVYERNVIFFDPITATDYKFTTNSDSFLGFMPGQVLCTQFSAESNFENPNFPYWRRTIAFQFRNGAPNTTPAKAWYRRIRAEGYYWKIPVRNGGADPSNADRHLFRAFDSEGQPTVKPMLHDKSTGERIDNPANAQWYEFKVYESKPFTMLLTI